MQNEPWHPAGIGSRQPIVVGELEEDHPAARDTASESSITQEVPPVLAQQDVSPLSVGDEENAVEEEAATAASSEVTRHSEKQKDVQSDDESDH